MGIEDYRAKVLICETYRDTLHVLIGCGFQIDKAHHVLNRIAQDEILDC
jgi:hypothetical protein